MITLTIQQADLLIQAIDAAIRAGGINAAAQFLPVANEIHQQAQQAANAASGRTTGGEQEETI